MKLFMINHYKIGIPLFCSFKRYPQNRLPDQVISRSVFINETRKTKQKQNKEMRNFDITRAIAKRYIEISIERFKRKYIIVTSK